MFPSKCLRNKQLCYTRSLNYRKLSEANIQRCYSSPPQADVLPYIPYIWVYQISVVGEVPKCKTVPVVEYSQSNKVK